jgi:predicted TPR repeat methyltransferase
MTPDRALDLYAKVEDLLGVKEAAPDLYRYYFDWLERIEVHSLLDVGCGSGDFLSRVRASIAPERLMGIDLSPLMVEQARAKGLDVRHGDLCEIEGRFDVVTAVFDMLNYLDRRALKHFLACVAERIVEGGYFLCDVNTVYGFEEIAVGAYVVDAEERFLTIESDYEEGVYSSEFTLFEKQDKACFAKSQERISQYYHTADEIEALLPGMVRLESREVTLYGEEPDKHFLVYVKRKG